MTASDSVSIFTEGTFEEQIQELVLYIGRDKSEEEQAAFLKPFQDALEAQGSDAEHEQRRRTVFQKVLGEVKTLGDGSEKEMEGFFNLLFAHLLSLWPVNSAETKAHVTTLLHVISSAHSADESIKYRVLSNLFNALPRRSALRLPVYNAILRVASITGDLAEIRESQAVIERWLSEWEISTEEKSEFWKGLADTYVNEPEASYDYILSYLQSLPASSPAAKTAAIDAIAQALRLPSIFNFDPLFKIDAVLAAKDHELFSLLHIFLNDGFPEFNAWAESHNATFATYGLDRAQLERKVRLLTLASLCFQNAGKDISYSTIASALQIEPSEVERWVIDVIRAQLLTGKLSQTSQTLRVIRAKARTFERAQWEVLESRLVAWKQGLSSVLQVVSTARATQKKAPVVVVKEKDNKEDSVGTAVAQDTA
ncbi:PCI-domain-containing protein [Punctularia strigosozonata HHB-11173 SS5]|uniref:PCI-domain-containing protein n=1 Tax=Punctularia strigosozonata (strain HHB-11173) TaxID=741275 RepID=UPI0004417A7F|nr:PCI-domain-containing protein [Punctularia strigosozonata HHB-11173 SS5]EIN10991.1 PCI-domain-containing protein [Punctularia strigosozonata HHB-11173 SS5]